MKKKPAKKKPTSRAKAAKKKCAADVKKGIIKRAGLNEEWAKDHLIVM